VEHGEHSNPDDHLEPRLRVTITREPERVVAELDGELDLNCASDARAQIDEAIERAVAHDITRLVIDASGLRFCDSTGLSVLLSASDTASARGIKFSVRELSAPMRELLRITGLDALVEN
jgi:anti-sigma B factor antagonist